MFSIFIRIAFLSLPFQNVESNTNLHINASSPSENLNRFWDSTGFCPPAPRTAIEKFLFSNDVKVNTLLISSLPNNAIKYIRIHWLLDLVTVSAVHDTGRPIYDFSKLEAFFDWLHEIKLYPHFELMGNPSSYFNDFGNGTQVRHWELLIREIVIRSAVRYKSNYISKWRFESWNEPDLKGYNILNFTLPGYLSYIDACKNGLVAASQSLNTSNFTFGGPAGLFKDPKKHILCWGLLSKCNQIKNCPLDYISFHKKGNGTAEGVLNGGIELAEHIQQKYPNLRNISLANDESDILTGWSKSREWRADARYAAMVVKVVIDHYRNFIHHRALPLQVLSNDNAFLNYHPFYFTQRTLLARFQINNTSPPHIQFIKKPVYVAMALLSYLGDKVLPAHADESSLVSTLVTASEEGFGYEFAVVLTYVDDARTDANITRKITVSVRNLPSAEYKYVVYVLDNVKSNPFSTWRELGAPVFPDAEARKKMRDVEGPFRSEGPTTLHVSDLQVQLQLTLPSVALVHLCAKGPRDRPGPVEDLRVLGVTHGEVLISWSDRSVGTRCVRTYEIEFVPDVIGGEIGDQLFRRLNADDVIFLWYQHRATGSEGSRGVCGWYRVRAVDYWGRRGEFSPVRKWNCD